MQKLKKIKQKIMKKIYAKKINKLKTRFKILDKKVQNGDINNKEYREYEKLRKELKTMASKFKITPDGNLDLIKEEEHNNTGENMQDNVTMQQQAAPQQQQAAPQQQQAAPQQQQAPPQQQQAAPPQQQQAAPQQQQAPPQQQAAPQQQQAPPQQNEQEYRLIVVMKDAPERTYKMPKRIAIHIRNMLREAMDKGTTLSIGVDGVDVNNLTDEEILTSRTLNGSYIIDFVFMPEEEFQKLLQQQRQQQ